MEALKKYLFEAQDAFDQIQVILDEKQIKLPVDYENDLIIARDIILKLSGFVECLDFIPLSPINL